MNSFGRIFRVHIFGESHGEKIGITIDGCPAGMALSAGDFEYDLARRRSGAKGTTPRKETDVPAVVSGLYKGYTTGAPVTVLFENTDVQSSTYEAFTTMPRPGHADFTAARKWNGYNDPRGGGHLSGRLAVALVAAGVMAKKIIAPMELQAKVIEIGGEKEWNTLLEKTIVEKDSLGGIIECRAQNMPVGLGEPFFDSVESLIGHAVFSIPAVKGIEFGEGFEAARMKGSQHNDVFISTEGKTATNHAGGINGGITNGNELVFRVAVKPTSSIGKSQQTMNMQTGELTALQIEGRHDACIALRMPVIVEAAAAMALADVCLLRRAHL